MTFEIQYFLLFSVCKQENFGWKSSLLKNCANVSTKYWIAPKSNRKTVAEQFVNLLCLVWAWKSIKRFDLNGFGLKVSRFGSVRFGLVQIKIPILWTVWFEFEMPEPHWTVADCVHMERGPHHLCYQQILVRVIDKSYWGLSTNPIDGYRQIKPTHPTASLLRRPFHLESVPSRQKF